MVESQDGGEGQGQRSEVKVKVKVNVDPNIINSKVVGPMVIGLGEGH